MDQLHTGEKKVGILEFGKQDEAKCPVWSEMPCCHPGRLLS